VYSISVSLRFICFIMAQNGVDWLQVHTRTNRRSGHISVVYKDRMIVWGGYMVNITKLVAV
jgi:hypothetical protein